MELTRKQIILIAVISGVILLLTVAADLGARVRRVRSLLRISKWPLFRREGRS